MGCPSRLCSSYEPPHHQHTNTPTHHMVKLFNTAVVPMNLSHTYTRMHAHTHTHTHVHTHTHTHTHTLSPTHTHSHTHTHTHSPTHTHPHTHTHTLFLLWSPYISATCTHPNVLQILILLLLSFLQRRRRVCPACSWSRPSLPV